MSAEIEFDYNALLNSLLGDKWYDPVRSMFIRHARSINVSAPANVLFARLLRAAGGSGSGRRPRLAVEGLLGKQTCTATPSDHSPSFHSLLYFLFVFYALFLFFFLLFIQPSPFPTLFFSLSFYFL